MSGGNERERIHPVDRAHLTGRSRPSPPIHRYAPPADLADLVDRYWIPVWSLTEPSTQTTLQHPACLLVVSNTYGRLYGVARGASSVTLEGDGYAVGVMLRPAAGRLLLGAPVTALTDTWVDLEDVDTLDGRGLVAEVRDAMAVDPGDEGAHRRAVAAYERRLRPFLPVDDGGRLVNAAVDWLTAHPEATRVTQLAEALGLGERTLHRLVVDRVGLAPKWLIQRRRLHDAVVALKTGSVALSEVAADLGYTDQAHFTRDFRTVTGMTPGAFLSDQVRP